MAANTRWGASIEHRSFTGAVPAGYTYPATYKVCTASARGGTTEAHIGLRGTGSPPLSGCARLAWFPDGYRVSIFPYRSALRPNPASRAHRPRYSAFPTAVGGLLALEGPTLRVTTGEGVEALRLVGMETTRQNLAASTSLAAPARLPHAALRA